MDITKESYNHDPNEIEEIMVFLDQHSWLKPRVKEFVKLRNFCSNKDQINMIKDLISNFVFLEQNDVYSACEDIKNYLYEHNYNATNTIIYCFSDSAETDGSQAFMYSFKNHLPRHDGWNDINFNNSFLNIQSHNNNFKNIILLDDFIGSGQTAEKRILKAKSYLDKIDPNISIAIISLASMEFGINYLLSKEITVFSPIQIKKGLSDYYIGEELEKRKDMMSELESKLSQKKRFKRFYPFGFEQSEALFSYGWNNIPNNVFPIFWVDETKDGKPRETIFRRI